MIEVNAVIDQNHYTTQIRTATNSLVADEPVANGGQGTGFNPEELLAASLAACTSITLRMYADRKEMQLEKIDVKVTLERKEAGTIANFHRSITLHGVLTEEQRERLLHIANHCPIHKILSNQVHIKTAIL